MSSDRSPDTVTRRLTSARSRTSAAHHEIDLLPSIAGDPAQALLKRDRIRFLDDLVFPHWVITVGQGARQGDRPTPCRCTHASTGQGQPLSYVHAKCRMAWKKVGKRDDAARDTAIWNVRKRWLSTIRAIIKDGIVTMSDAGLIPLA